MSEIDCTVRELGFGAGARVWWSLLRPELRLGADAPLNRVL